MNIEVEARSFITKEKYEEFLDFFNKNAKFVKEDYQETFYFDSEQDSDQTDWPDWLYLVG